MNVWQDCAKVRWCTNSYIRHLGVEHFVYYCDLQVCSDLALDSFSLANFAALTHCASSKGTSGGLALLLCFLQLLCLGALVLLQSIDGTVLAIAMEFRILKTAIDGAWLVSIALRALAETTTY